MCGICGVVSANGSVDPERVVRMSAGGRPAANEDGTLHLVHDGEIYNYPELRRELELVGHTFRTHADTEVLVHLYEEHGDGFAARLRGMFAVAIWDARRRRLVLARDRFGSKPLYYRDADAELAFASELRVLPRGDVDLDAVDAFLAFNAIPAPLTIFRQSRKLAAGHLLLWEDGRVRLERFARVAHLPEREGDSAELSEELRSRLRDSVRAHLAGDAAVGVLLSGGIHSAVLAALAAQESRKPLRTFSIGFEARTSAELANARRVAERYGTEHRELVLRPDPEVLLPALVDTFDEPFGHSSALPAYLVSELAASDVKVALSGMGGDELFGHFDDRAREVFSPDLRAELTGRRSAFDFDPVDDGLVKTGRASTAHSLEARFPYLDSVVTNLVLALPTRRTLRRPSKKALLRKAAAPLLPREIVRRKQHGSPLPAAWLRGELEPFVRETLSADTLRRQGYFEPRVVQRLLDDHVAGREDLSRQLWALLAFTLWHERHVEHTPGDVRMPELLAER